MLYVIRHGRTERLEQKRHQGWANNPLSEKGEVQAWRAGARLLKHDGAKNATAIFCSPLLRCRQTADAINKFLNLPIIFDERITEYSKGSLEGMWKASLGPVLYEDGMTNPRKYGGENHDDVYKRVKSFIDDLRKKKIDNVIIVTHQGTINMIKYVIEHDKWDAGNFKDDRDNFRNGEIYEFNIYRDK